MITINATDRGTDDATLMYILKSAPSGVMDDMLKSMGMEIGILDDNADLEMYEPVGKSEFLDLLKARKASLRSSSAGSKEKQKIRKRILCHRKNGTEYYQERLVNADTAKDATLSVNPMKAFDEKVSRVRYSATQNLTQEAANVEDMKSTPEGLAALKAINEAIGSGSPHGKLTTNLKYTNIRYCTDPTPVYDGDGNIINGCVAIAKNPKTGKDQYFYSKAYRDVKNAERAQRAIVMGSDKAQAYIRETLNSDGFENEDVRDCLKLMAMYGMKSGNEQQAQKNQLGDYLTAGATTLKAGNIFSEKKKRKNKETGKMETYNRVYLQFYQQGEKGDKAHQQIIEIDDPALAASLLARKEAAASDDDRVFSCTKNDTLAVCSELFECTNEDLRLAFGYSRWHQATQALLGNNPLQRRRVMTTDEKTGKRRKMTLAEVKESIIQYMMDEMGVTDRRSVTKYINPRVLALFEQKEAEKGKKKGKKKTAPKKKPASPKSGKSGKTTKKPAPDKGTAKDK